MYMKEIYHILALLKMKLYYLNVNFKEIEKETSATVFCYLNYGDQQVREYREDMTNGYNLETIYERLASSFTSDLLFNNIYDLFKQAKVDYEAINEQKKKEEQEEYERQSLAFNNSIKEKLSN